MHHPTAFVTPVMEHWLEREIAKWVHSMKDRSDNPLHHEQKLLPRSYISLLTLWKSSSLPKSVTILADACNLQVYTQIITSKSPIKIISEGGLFTEIGSDKLDVEMLLTKCDRVWNLALSNHCSKRKAIHCIYIFFISVSFSLYVCMIVHIH